MNATNYTVSIPLSEVFANLSAINSGDTGKLHNFTPPM